MVPGPVGAGDCADPLPAAGRQQLQAPGLTLAFSPQPAPVPLNQPFALRVRLCAAQGQPAPTGLAVDAEMPAHRHGMNYRPRVSAQADGQYRVEGLLFHMPGHWRLHFVIERGAGQPPLRMAADLRL